MGPCMAMSIPPTPRLANVSSHRPPSSIQIETLLVAALFGIFRPSSIHAGVWCGDRLDSAGGRPPSFVLSWGRSLNCLPVQLDGLSFPSYSHVGCIVGRVACITRLVPSPEGAVPTALLCPSVFQGVSFWGPFFAWSCRSSSALGRGGGAVHAPAFGRFWPPPSSSIYWGVNLG